MPVKENSELEASRAQITQLKAEKSDLDNAYTNSRKELGQAHKDLAEASRAHAENEKLKADLGRANAEIAHLKADLTSASAKGGRDSEIVAAAKQVKDGLAKL